MTTPPEEIGYGSLSTPLRPTGMRLLLATDGSAGAGRALRLLTSSVQPDQVGTVEVISVVDRATVGPASEPTDAQQSLLEQRRWEAGERLVHLAAEELRTAGFEALETVRAGHPAETIVAQAIGGKHDLVILGTRGVGGPRQRVVGSVSAQVARYAPTSVLVAKSSGPVRSVLLGYDASPDADEALALVARLPLHVGAHVTVLSAYDVMRPVDSGLAPTMVNQLNAAYGNSLRWAREAADAMSTNAADRLLARGVPATHLSTRGPAARQLAIAAGEQSADLVVVGSRGLAAVQRFFLGSTSAALVTQPPTSVLVVRGIDARA